MFVRRKKAQTTRAWDALKANVPIVAVTANAFEEDVATAKEAGMNGHLAKPYDIDAMMEMLDRLIPIDPANTARL